MPSKAKILIVDDHPLVTEGLQARISAQPDMEVCGTASGETRALSLLKTASPTLVIVDLLLKTGHGLSLIRKIAKRAPQVRILVLSAYEESLFAERALRGGAHGYVNKQEAQEKIIEALRTLLKGERYLSPGMTQRLADRAADSTLAVGSIESLSDPELQIFELIGHGTTTRLIANQLGLSMQAVETHRENIRAKLGLRDGAELMQRAVQFVLEPRQSP